MHTAETMDPKELKFPEIPCWGKGKTEAWCQTAGRSWPSKKGTVTHFLITYGTTFKKDQIKDNGWLSDGPLISTVNHAKLFALDLNLNFMPCILKTTLRVTRHSPSIPLPIVATLDKPVLYFSQNYLFIWHIEDGWLNLAYCGWQCAG